MILRSAFVKVVSTIKTLMSKVIATVFLEDVNVGNISEVDKQLSFWEEVPTTSESAYNTDNLKSDGTTNHTSQ